MQKPQLVHVDDALIAADKPADLLSVPGRGPQNADCLAARLQSGTPWIGRDGIYDLESIAVTVIGGTLLAGGKGGVAGTLAGVLLFASLDAGFNMLGIDAFLKQVLRGAIVIAAVAVHAVRAKGHVA